MSGRILSCLLLALGASIALAEPIKLKPNREWGAVIRDDKLKVYAPKNGLITDQKTFEKVWKAWRPTDKTPEINFGKEFVFVAVSSGPNRVSMQAALDDGKLAIKTAQTLIAGEGFGYILATFNRKDVKTVNGAALPEK